MRRAAEVFWLETSLTLQRQLRVGHRMSDRNAMGLRVLDTNVHSFTRSAFVCESL
jgi:hypothetical protein